MKVTVNRSKLIEVLADIIRVSPTRHTLPVLSTALLQAKDGYLSVAGTDLTTALVARLKVKIVKNGAVCVSPRALLTFLKAVTTELVVMTLGKGALRVEAGKAATSLTMTAAKEYPPLPKRINSAPTIVTNLAEVLEAVGCSMAKDETRPVLHGAYMDGKAGIVAAADGFRLSTSTLKVRGKGKLPCAIIDGMAVPVIKAVFPGKVSVSSRKEKAPGYKDETNFNTFVQFEEGDRLLTTMAIRGNFPQYGQLIPKGGSIARFDRDEMKSAIKLTLTANPETYMTRFITKGHNINVFTICDDNRTEMAVASKGKVKIAFDARYIRDILNNLPQGEVVMRTTAPGSPALFRANGTTHVLMPMFAAETMPPEKPVTPAPVSHPCSEAATAVAQA